MNEDRLIKILSGFWLGVLLTAVPAAIIAIVAKLLGFL